MTTHHAHLVKLIFNAARGGGKLLHVIKVVVLVALCALVTKPSDAPQHFLLVLEC